MKWLIFILVLLIAAQPVQAGVCAMDTGDDPPTAHHADMAASSGHACCDTDDTDPRDACDTGMNCGMCFVSVSALPMIPRVEPAWSRPVYGEFSTGVILPSHSSPPFRPPIA